VTLVLDAGALIALERGDRTMWGRLKLALNSGQVPISHGGVIGQVWRGRGPREALLSRALAAVEVRALDGSLGRKAGELLSLARKRDVIDAAVVLCAVDGDLIVTSDPEDIETLARAARLSVDLIVP